MDNVEAAIRKAFEKGSPGNREFRMKVYKSALAALERGLAAKPGLDPAAAEKRRAGVKATIRRVEAEFTAPSAPPPARTAPAARPAQPRPVAEPRIRPRQPPLAEPVRNQLPPTGARNGRVEPEFGPVPEAPRSMAWDAAEPQRQPVFHDEEPRFDRVGADFPAPRYDDSEFDPDDDYRPERSAYAPPAPRRKRRFLRSFGFLALVGLLFVGAAGWYLSGLILVEQDQPQTAAPEQQPPQPQLPSAVSVGAEEDWLEIFNPADPARLSAPPEAAAQTVDVDGRPVLRIAGGAPVVFDIAPGILETLSGRSAMFSILANATGDEGETQFSVDCDFAGLGDCGRRRFAPRLTPEEFLFEAELGAGGPTGAGRLTIVPDVTGAGRALEIVSIRAAPAD